MKTDLAIVNEALLQVGVNRQLTNLADRSAEGNAASLVLPTAKAELLGSNHWSFARRLATLEEVTLDTADERWAHAYRRPEGCVTPIRIWTGQRRPATHVPFEPGYGLVDGERVELILTDQPDALLEHVNSEAIAATAQPGTEFEAALVAAVAAKLAMPLKADRALKLDLQREAELLRQIAVAHDANSAVRDPEPLPEPIRKRL